MAFSQHGWHDLEHQRTSSRIGEHSLIPRCSAPWLNWSDVKLTALQPIIRSHHPSSRTMASLKTAIKCHETEDWVRILSVVLLRSALKEDIRTTAIELVYGQQLKLPAEYFIQEELTAEPFSFLEHLKESMRRVRPSHTAHHNNHGLSRRSHLTHVLMCLSE